MHVQSLCTTKLGEMVKKTQTHHLEECSKSASVIRYANVLLVTFNDSHCTEFVPRQRRVSLSFE